MAGPRNTLSWLFFSAVPVSDSWKVSGSEVAVTALVARSPDEAERLVRGEDITVRREETEQEQAVATAEGFFDNPEATPLPTDEGEAALPEA